jgi:hypothetical protein
MNTRRANVTPPQEARARKKRVLDERMYSARNAGHRVGGEVMQTITDVHGGLFIFVGGSCGPSLGTRYMGRGKQVFGAPPSRQRNEDDKPKRRAGKESAA